MNTDRLDRLHALQERIGGDTSDTLIGVLAAVVTDKQWDEALAHLERIAPPANAPPSSLPAPVIATREVRR